MLELDWFTLQLTVSAGLVYGVNGVWEPPGAADLFAIDGADAGTTLAWHDGSIAGGLGRVRVTDAWTYWTSHETRLWRTPRVGGAPRPVYAPEDFDRGIGGVRAIGGLGDDVFVATESAILRVRSDAGDAEILALAEENFMPVWIGPIRDDLVWHEVAHDGSASAIHRLLLP